MAKKSLVNISMDAEFVEMIKTQAKERGFERMSDYVYDLLKKLGLENKDAKRVIFQIPPEALKEQSALERWLARSSSDVVKHFFK